MNNGYHTPVLLEKVLEYLITSTDGIYVDGTVGGGGHAEVILNHLSSKGKLIGFDADEDAIAYAGKKLAKYQKRVELIHENFAHMKSILQKHNIHSVDGMLLDLGVSSFQLEQPGKGFSFQRDEQLDMRMDRRKEIDAAYLVNTADESELQNIFRKYGEERFAGKIAKTIAKERKTNPIETTGSLASLVENVVGRKYLRKSLARIFQALRIAVNDELTNLLIALQDTLELVRVGGRILVISYHSLEDRIVKDFFKLGSAKTVPSDYKLIPSVERPPRLRILTKKPVRPSEGEIRANRRARSAKLRAAERV